MNSGRTRRITQEKLKLHKINLLICGREEKDSLMGRGVNMPNIRNLYIWEHLKVLFSGASIGMNYDLDSIWAGRIQLKHCFICSAFPNDSKLKTFANSLAKFINQFSTRHIGSISSLDRPIFQYCNVFTSEKLLHYMWYMARSSNILKYFIYYFLVIGEILTK